MTKLCERERERECVRNGCSGFRRASCINKEGNNEEWSFLWRN